MKGKFGDGSRKSPEPTKKAFSNRFITVVEEITIVETVVVKHMEQGQKSQSGDCGASPYRAPRAGQAETEIIAASVFPYRRYLKVWVLVKSHTVSSRY